MNRHTPRSRARRQRRLALVAVVLGVASMVPSGAVQRPTMFADSFDELGPLAGNAPSDPYEIKRGSWEVVDLPDLLTFGNPRRVLRQNAKTGTPKEPVVFVRDASFRALSVQVTGALIDNIPGSSLGIVFRAPILEDQTADPDNLYLFTAMNTGFVRGFPTGRAFALFKRVGEGYFMLDDQIVHTWADLTRPHTYKVTMDGGHIRAFVDGNLVITHTDIPSGDLPTVNDRFPGLPYHAGSVGLRTSSAKAWFDDLVIVADDAYEGRATAIDAHYSYPIPLDARTGSEQTLTQELDNHGLSVLDTGFVYADDDFDRWVIKAYEDGRTEIGPSLRTHNEGDTVHSNATLMRAFAELTDLTGRITIRLDAAKISASVSADCESTTSSVDLGDTMLTVEISDGNNAEPDTVLGPFNIQSSYKPNTVLYNQPGVFMLMAHRRIKSTRPHWIQASALTLMFPNEDIQVQEINLGGTRVAPATNLGASPGLVVDIARAVAGRYCSPMVEVQD